LLGGVIIKANDKVLDGSVRGKLKQLGEVLAA
jgi:F0F1-type ATP synthase delta subunit